MKHVTLFLTVLFSCTITAFSEEPVTGPSMMMDASEGTGTMMSAYEPMVIVVDYDSAKDLRKKYSITYQHTYVRIDADGKTLLIWNGGGVDSILSHIKREEVK
jgi:hypothetical protein